jgi:hypothetical protein
MKLTLSLIALLAALSLPLPATAGTVVFDYHGCNRPVTLTVDDANSLAVWRQLAGQAGFQVRAGDSVRHRNAHFSMSGPLYEVLAAFAKYSGAVLVASDDASCLGARHARTVWLMSEGMGDGGTLATTVSASPTRQESEPVSVPISSNTSVPRFVENAQGDKVRVYQPNQRRYLRDLERSQRNGRRNR